VKPLGVEEVLRSISVAAGIVGLGDGKVAEEEAPMTDMGKRRRQANMFRYAFMDDEGEEGEQFAGTIARALLLMNSYVIQEVITARQGSLVGQVLSEQASIEARLEQLFLATLSRPPDATELSRFRSHVEARRGAAAAYEDVAWALFNASEFLTNH
jgi:hypothetical protein